MRSTPLAYTFTLIAAATAAQAQDPPVPGEAIVRVLAGVEVGDAILNLEQMIPGVTFAAQDTALAGRGIYQLSYLPVESGTQVEAVLTSLDTNPQNTTMIWGELDYEGRDPEGHTGSVWFHSVGGAALYPIQYAGQTTGMASAQQRTTGRGVVVAVLDTGIDVAHPALAGRIAPGGFNFLAGTTDVSDAGDGFDSDGDGDIDESVGHGTFVAGLIHLYAPDALLLPVVVLDSDGLGDAWAFARGLFYAIDQGAAVINLSLGSTYKSAAVEDAVEEAKELGIVVVAAGGNENAGQDLEQFPAAQSSGFGVAAVDDADVRASFSNYNPDFFLSAPGTSAPDAGGPDGFDPDRTIYSTVPGGGYGIWEGTSFATAFVSGGVALLHGLHPEWPASAWTYDRIEALLAATAADIDSINPAFAGQLGVGRLETGAAVDLAAGDLDLDGAVDVDDFIAVLESWGSCGGATCFADLNGDGFVGVDDFLAILANWG